MSAQRGPGGVPDLSDVNAVTLVDYTTNAWTRINQLHLALRGLHDASRKGLTIGHTHIDAVYELSDEARDEVGSVRVLLGWTEEELGL